MPKTRYESRKPSYQTRLYHSQPPMGSVAVFEWETFSPLQDFTDQSLIEVFKRISSDIIERPYHYDPHKAFDAQGKQISYLFTNAGNSKPPAKIPGVAVYKQNHGTGHAIRQMFYTDTLIDKIAVSGNPKGQAIAQNFNSNPEVKSILKLAAYCKRIGRTFDHERDNPGQTTIYSKRSSEMFAQMARELGYNEDLIQAISESMLEPIPKGPTTLSGKTIAGMKGTDLRDFSESVLMAAHMADLSRLFQVKREFIETSLRDYFKPDQLSTVSTELVEMACKANAMTGNPVVQQENGVKHEITSLNGRKLVAVVNDIGKAVKDLSQLRLVAPSVAPLVSPKPPKPQQGYLLNKHKRNFNDNLNELDVKVRELEALAKSKPKEYTKIAQEMRQLHTTLTQEKDTFFTNPTIESFKYFRQQSIMAIDSVEKTAKEHRGWHTVHPILRAIVGVLAAISVIPALMVAKKSKHGFIQTFFAKPETDTQQKKADFKQKFIEQTKEIEDELESRPNFGGK